MECICLVDYWRSVFCGCVHAGNNQTILISSPGDRQEPTQWRFTGISWTVFGSTYFYSYSFGGDR
jgi:hypothetical protein